MHDSRPHEDEPGGTTTGALSTEVSALAALAAAEYPSHVSARLEDAQVLPQVLASLRSLLQGRELRDVPPHEINQVVLDAVEALDGGKTGTALARRGSRKPTTTRLPVGQVEFPPPISSDDKAAIKNASILAGRSALPAYWEGVMILKQQITVQRVHRILQSHRRDSMTDGVALAAIRDVFARVQPIPKRD